MMIESAKKRAGDAEEAMEDLCKKYRQSRENTLSQEVITLKGKLANIESQLHRESIEKNEVIKQKEQFRLAAQRLVSFLPENILNITFTFVSINSNPLFYLG